MSASYDMTDPPTFYEPNQYLLEEVPGGDIRGPGGGDIRLPEEYLERARGYWLNRGDRVRRSAQCLPAGEFDFSELIKIAKEVGARLIVKTSADTYYFKCRFNNGDTYNTIREKLQITHYPTMTAWIIRY